MAESAEVFGKPNRRGVNYLAPVPMFDPMLAAARELVKSLEWFGREVGKAEDLCTNMETVTAQMVESKIAEDAARHVDAAVKRLREKIMEARNYHDRLDGLAADLHGGEDETFKMPRVAGIGSVAHE